MQDTVTLTITKSELKEALGCTTWGRFYSKFLTPEVIENVLGLSTSEYKRIREFSVPQTRALRQYFRLDNSGETV